MPLSYRGMFLLIVPQQLHVSGVPCHFSVSLEALLDPVADPSSPALKISLFITPEDRESSDIESIMLSQWMNNELFDCPNPVDAMFMQTIGDKDIRTHIRQISWKRLWGYHLPFECEDAQPHLC